MSATLSRLGLAAYIIGAAWGFGYAWHRHDCGLLDAHSCAPPKAIGALLAGAVWPLTAGVAVMRP